MNIVFSRDPALKLSKIDDFLDPPVVVHVHGLMNADCLKSFNENFQKALYSPQPVIPITIDSYGGEAAVLLSMVSNIQTSPKPVATIVMGFAYSAAAILVTFGQKGMRYASPCSRLLIHEVSSGEWGKVSEMKAGTEFVDKLNSDIFRLMAKNCGKPSSYFFDEMKKRSNADWYLTGPEAKKEGLVDQVRVPSLDINVGIKYNFG